MRGRLTIAAFALLGLLACQLIVGIERVDKSAPPAAAEDAAVQLEAGADPCSHARPPPPPTRDDAPNDTLDRIYLGLRTVTLVPPNTAGFDLDHSCTCDVRPNTAFDGGASCATMSKPKCDSDGGVDNELGGLFRSYAGFVDIDKAADIDGIIASGRQNSILVISKYNGRANDNDVAFGIFSSEGMREGPACPSSTTVDGFSTPGWCGEDVWTASSLTVQRSGDSFVPKVVGTGYVTNYRFVVEFGAPLLLPFGGNALEVSSAVATGRLVPLDEKLEIVETATAASFDRIRYWRAEEGTIGGRIASADLLFAVGLVNNAGDGGGTNKPLLCTLPQFAALKSAICDHVDVSHSTSLDFTADARCDALSIAIGTTAASVKIGKIAEPAPPPPNTCPTSGSICP